MGGWREGVGVKNSCKVTKSSQEVPIPHHNALQKSILNGRDTVHG